MNSVETVGQSALTIAASACPNAPRASRSTPDQHREEGQQSKYRDECRKH